MEPEQEALNRIQEATGTTEQEARAIYHLNQARKILGGSAVVPGRGVDVALHAKIRNSFDALYSVIGETVLKRQYPDWPTGEQVEGQDT